MYTTTQDTNLDIQQRKELTEKYIAREVELTPEQEKFLNEKLSSKLWRLDNLYTIRDKDAVKMTLKLNAAQRKVLTQYKHTKKIILKSRQQGISTLFLAYYLDSCLFTPGFQAGIQSYGQDEAEKLARRAELMWDELDTNVKQIMGLTLVSNNSKGMTFSNGSVLKIGNFRGDTLQGLHVSELGKIAKKFPEKARELKTGAFQAVGKKNRITIESTAEGPSGLFYEMWQTATRTRQTKKKLSSLDFEPIFLSWLEDPDCTLSTPEEILPEHQEYFAEIERKTGATLTDQQKWWYVAKKRELGPDFNQEYPATPKMAFAQSLDGTYYANEFKHLDIVEDTSPLSEPPVNLDRNLLVHLAFDLGMNDTFAIGMFQKHPDGHIEIIGEYMDSGHGLEHYREILDSIANKWGIKYGITYVPHDAKVKELIADKTRFQALKELRFNPLLVKKHRIMDGIEATRKFLRTVRINSKCSAIIKAIQTYRKKYDRRYDIYLDSPVHDESSHAADMVRYIAMGDKTKPITKIYVHQPSQGRKVMSKSFDI